ncbi:MAG: hypothetical protein ABSB23_19000 [Bryobacteraceae bacterium]
MLQASSWVGTSFRAVACLLAACGLAHAADPQLAPVGVCEVLRHLAAWENKSAVIVGRYSFRPTGRWVSEQVCDPGAAEPPQLWIVEDEKDGPRPPEGFELDAAAVRQKLAEIERHTALAKFRFGSPGYDRWAVVYGRVEARKGDDAKKAPANLVICGTAVIVILNAE